MDAKLQEMLDHYEITRTLSEYCHGCDRCDAHRMSSAYLEDSWDDHGAVKASGPEFARIMTGMMLDTSESVFHLLGQSLINVRGDEAGAETYFLAVAQTRRPDGVRVCNQLGGRYVDKLLRESGRWKIKHRIALRDWTISLPIEGEWAGASALTAGQRSNEDPSFAALGIAHSGVPAARHAAALGCSGTQQQRS